MPTDNKALNKPASDKQHCVNPEWVGDVPCLQDICDDAQRLYGSLMANQSIGGAATLDELIDTLEIVGRLAGYISYRELLQPYTCPRCGTDARAGYHLCTHPRSTPISPFQPNPTPIK